jgi:hypothetical protein
LLEFFEKEESQKVINEKNQVSVGTCYQDAVERLNHIHTKNEEYSQQAETELGQSLRRNNKFGLHISKKRRILSQSNRKVMLK